MHVSYPFIAVLASTAMLCLLTPNLLLNDVTLL